MCVLDCAPNALKMLHNSTEFMPYVIFIAAPGMEQLKNLYAERRVTGGSQRNLAVSLCSEEISSLSPHSDQYTKRFRLRLHFLVRPAKLNSIQLTASTYT